MGIIISGFPCIGKTTLGKKYGAKVIDLESTKYKYIFDENYKDVNFEKIKLNLSLPRNPKWPYNYIEAIKNASKNYDIVFVLGKYDFCQLMKENNIKFYVAFPDDDENQKQDYLHRALVRNNPPEFIKLFSDNFEKWKHDLKLLDVPQINLKKGEYISDAIRRLKIYDFEKQKSNDDIDR